MSSPFPAAPPPPEFSQPPAQSEASIAAGWREAPRQLRPVAILLAINLGLSIILTVVTLLLRHSIVNYQLDHRHITDPQQRAALRDGYVAGIIGRVVGNIVVSVVYVFLVRALFRGRRWAYRRVILLGGIGIVGLIAMQFTPYPAWMHVEQVLQAIVLSLLLYFVTRPGVRAHFAPDLPGRTTKRFGRR
jgi:hypothetical protein